MLTEKEWLLYAKNVLGKGQNMAMNLRTKHDCTENCQLKKIAFQHKKIANIT